MQGLRSLNPKGKNIKKKSYITKEQKKVLRFKKNGYSRKPPPKSLLLKQVLKPVRAQLGSLRERCSRIAQIPVTNRKFQVPRHATHDIGWTLLKDISKQSGVKL